MIILCGYHIFFQNSNLAGLHGFPMLTLSLAENGCISESSKLAPKTSGMLTVLRAAENTDSWTACP